MYNQRHYKTFIELIFQHICTSLQSRSLRRLKSTYSDNDGPVPVDDTLTGWLEDDINSFALVFHEVQQVVIPDNLSASTRTITSVNKVASSTTE